jgi:hypothetical protein
VSVVACVLPAVLAAALSILATPVARGLARRLGAIDHMQDGRSVRFTRVVARWR